MVHGGETEHNEIPARGASTALTAEAPVAVPVPARDTGRRGVAGGLASAAAACLSRSRGHIAVAVLYLAGAVAVLSRQWRDPAHTYLIGSGQDQHMWEWFFAETARAVAGPHNPLGTNLQNFPDGVNMMANTASFGVGIPLTPVTLLFGPPVTFVLVLTLGLAGTGFAWYWLFARELVTSRSAAALGGLCCGFAPAMVSHGCAHPNFVLLAILPMLLLRMIRLARRAAAGLPVPRVREAVWLALLVSLQIALGEEPLLIFAVGFAVFAIGYYASEPATGRRILRTLLPTLGLGALITLVVCAIPLWWQFFGPQSYQAIDHGPVGNDLDSLIQFPTESLGGKLAPGKPVAMNPTEENAYFGWPLLVLTTATTIWLWRARHREHRVVRACATTALVCGVLSLGISLRIGRTDTGFILPWAALSHVPLLDTVLETRFILAAVPAIAAILALATERIIRYARISTTDIRPAVWFAALALALIPLVPTALPVTERGYTPQFFTDGTVRQFVDHGSVVVVPPPTRLDARPLNWQIDSGFSFPLAGGYFVGPDMYGKGRYGPDDRRTSIMLMRAQRSNRVQPVDEAAKARARADLAYWHADVLVLTQIEHGTAVRETLDHLLGISGRVVDGVFVWDVRSLR